MRIAGIRTSEGMIWADVGEYDVSLLDDVVVCTDDATRQGSVVISPDQLLNPPDPNGEIIAMHSRAQPNLSCKNFSGSHMPPLGSRVEIDGVEGRVVGLDVPNNLVTVRIDDMNMTVPSDALR